MRTLLVDNYDSFNLQPLPPHAKVNGEEPEVVRNDDTAWGPELLDSFDNVVLSPSPSSPHRLADFSSASRTLPGSAARPRGAWANRASSSSKAPG